MEKMFDYVIFFVWILFHFFRLEYSFNQKTIAKPVGVPPEFCTMTGPRRSIPKRYQGEPRWIVFEVFFFFFELTSILFVFQIILGADTDKINDVTSVRFVPICAHIGRSSLFFLKYQRVATDDGIFKIKTLMPVGFSGTLSSLSLGTISPKRERTGARTGSVGTS